MILFEADNKDKSTVLETAASNRQKWAESRSAKRYFKEDTWQRLDKAPYALATAVIYFDISGETWARATRRKRLVRGYEEDGEDYIVPESRRKKRRFPLRSENGPLLTPSGDRTSEPSSTR